MNLEIIALRLQTVGRSCSPFPSFFMSGIQITLTYFSFVVADSRVDLAFYSSATKRLPVSILNLPCKSRNCNFQEVSQSKAMACGAYPRRKEGFSITKRNKSYLKAHIQNMNKWTITLTLLHHSKIECFAI